MEIKTCEQYVLAKLEESESEVIRLQEENENLINNMKEMSTVIERMTEIIRRYTEIRTISADSTDPEDQYIKFEVNGWTDEITKKDVQYLISLLLDVE